MNINEVKVDPYLPRTFNCPNVSCRIVSFTGTYMAPMNACPVCQFVGGAVVNEWG